LEELQEAASGHVDKSEYSQKRRELRMSVEQVKRISLQTKLGKPKTIKKS
jgi:hypothetical protein